MPAARASQRPAASEGKEHKTDMPAEQRKALFIKAVEDARPEWTQAARNIFCAFYTRPIKPGKDTMLFETKNFDLNTRLATWIDYTDRSGNSFARAMRDEAARKRSIMAEEERLRRQQQRDAGYKQRQEAFVPLPVLQAFRHARLGDPFTMDKAAIIDAISRHIATHDAADLPPLLREWHAAQIQRRQTHGA